MADEKHIDTTRARAGASAGMRYVLAISLVAIILVFAFILLV